MQLPVTSLGIGGDQHLELDTVMEWTNAALEQHRVSLIIHLGDGHGSWLCRMTPASNLKPGWSKIRKMALEWTNLRSSQILGEGFRGT